MLARVVARRALQLARGNTRNSVTYVEGEVKHITMDDLPKFLGPYEEIHSKTQTKYNIWLAASAAFLVGTMATVHSMEILEWGNPPPMKN
ncbi:uncharacterized protein LOC135394904 [Ornithodoros turicata]|uniref:Putative conserved plasma membrane protein n=1 Tax=Ornithodoros turicata TaxID=34597 RepID=A0A2R5LGK3_9ACAR